MLRNSSLSFSNLFSDRHTQQTKSEHKKVKKKMKTNWSITLPIVTVKVMRKKKIFLFTTMKRREYHSSDWFWRRKSIKAECRPFVRCRKTVELSCVLFEWFKAESLLRANELISVASVGLPWAILTNTISNQWSLCRTFIARFQLKSRPV